MMNPARTLRNAASALIGCLVLTLVACGNVDESLEQMLADADASWQKGEVNAALLILKAATQRYPDAVEAREQLAEMYLRLSNHVAAQKEIDKAAERGLDKKRVELLTIRATLLRGDVPVALAKFETDAAIEQDPALRALHAEILMAAGKVDRAFDLFTAAAAEPDAPALAFLGLARIHATRGELITARSYLTQALTLDPRNPSIYMLLAEVADREGKSDEARTAVDQAAKWNPLSLGPPLARVRILLKSKQYEKARAELAALDKKAPKSPIVAYYKGLVAYMAADYEVAENEFREVLSMAPSHTLSQLYMGFLMYRKNNLEQAESFLTLYWQAHPDYVPATKLLASIQIKRKKPQEALKTLADIGADADGEMLGLRANAYFATGNTEAGINSLQAAVSAAPDNGNLKTALVLNKAQLGMVDEAIALLGPEAAVDQTMTRRESLLLYTYLTRQDWDKAIEVGLEMQKKFGLDPALLNALGTAYIGKKEPEKAKTLMLQALEASPETPTFLRNLAMLELNAGNLDVAQGYIDRALKSEPDDAGTLTLAGLAAASRREFDRAAEFYERARAVNPQALEARSQLASHYVRTQNYPKAVEVATEALELNPGGLPAMLDLGHGLRGTGQLDAAEKLARSALKSFPDSPKVQFLLGTILFERGQAPEAEAQLLAADKGLPSNADVKVALAKAVLARGGLSLAVEPILGAIEQLEGKSARLLALRGDLASAQDDPATATTFYEAARKLDDSDGWAVNEALALAKNGRGEDAVALLKARIEAHPESVQSRFYLAQIFERLGRGVEAAAAYEKVLELAPDNAIALNNLALLQLEAGNDGAVASAERAYALAPENPAIADTYGWVMLNRGKAEGALDALRSAAEAAPDDGDINFHFAVALARSGNTGAALQALERALKGGEFPSRAAADDLHRQLQP